MIKFKSCFFNHINFTSVKLRQEATGINRQKW